MKKKIIILVAGVCLLLSLAFFLPAFFRGNHYLFAGRKIAERAATELANNPVTTEADSTETKTNGGFDFWDYVNRQQEEFYGLFDLATEQTGVTADSTEQPSDPEGGMDVYFIDVGQGNAVLFQANGQNLLYDGGNWDTSEDVTQFLKEHGVTTLDYLVISHYDSDHCAGCIQVLEEFTVGQVLEPAYVHDSKTYEKLMETQKAAGVPVLSPEYHSTYSFGNGNFQIVCPVSYTYEESNNNSIGIRMVYGEKSFLLTGDAEMESEYDSFTEPMPTTVYLCGHHGSSSSTSEQLMKMVTPEIAVISVGADNEYGHPTEQTLTRIAGCEIYRTDLDGTIHMHTDGAALEIDTEKDNALEPAA